MQTTFMFLRTTPQELAAERQASGETRQMQRSRRREELKRMRQRDARATKRERAAAKISRVRAREARELEMTGVYQLPYLAARTAVGRLRRFWNEDGKLVRLA